MATQWDTAQHAQAMPDAAVAAVVSRRRAAVAAATRVTMAPAAPAGRARQPRRN